MAHGLDVSDLANSDRPILPVSTIGWCRVMKTFFRLFVASLFVGQFGTHMALAEPPHVVPAGLFTGASEESDAIITLLDPRDNDESILLIDGRDRTHWPVGWKLWPRHLPKLHQPLLTGHVHQSAPSARPLATPWSLDWKSQSEPGHDSKHGRASH